MLAVALSHPGLAVEAGAPSPALTGMDLRGRTVNLAAFRGRPVLVMFWATWCEPCRKEMPLVQAAWNSRGREAFAVIAVNAGETRAAVEQYLRKAGLDLPVVLDDEGAIAERFGVMGLPTNYLIGADGVIREIKVGGDMDRDWLDAITGAAR